MKDSYGRTPLSWAAAFGQETIVKMLIGRDDVDINLRDCRGRTPLDWAALYGHKAVVQLLQFSS